MLNSNKKLSVIIVNFRSEHYLEKCIASIYNKFPPDLAFEIIIVNNDKDGKLEGIRQKFPGAAILDLGENIGFGAGQNMGSSRAQGEYLFFLNPDTEILSDNISLILEDFERYENIAILGSLLLSPGGKIQDWSHGKEINLKKLIKNNLGWPDTEKLADVKKKKKTEWVSGTALFIRKKIFKDLGGFDEQFFMYFEDMDICKRARQLGQLVLFHPRFQVLHHGGKSYPNQKKQKKDYYDSQEYYFKKHHGKIKAGIIKLARKIFL